MSLHRVSNYKKDKRKTNNPNKNLSYRKKEELQASCK